jgi:hypothetical protein
MSRYRTQVLEVINRNTIVSLAFEQGFNIFLPVYDGGIDFIFYHETDNIIRKVQLKGRWTIDKNMSDGDIWIAFPFAGEWYVIPYEKLVTVADEQGFTRTKSWTEGGIYNLPKLSKAMLEACKDYKFSSLAIVASDAAIELKEETPGV